MKRKIWTLILLSTVAVFALVACGGAEEPTEVPAEVVEAHRGDGGAHRSAHRGPRTD